MLELWVELERGKVRDLGDIEERENGGGELAATCNIHNYILNNNPPNCAHNTPITVSIKILLTVLTLNM